MKNICVFCSAKDLDEKYIQDAQKFARLMVKNNYNLVWGGTNKGLMKAMASTVQNAGGKIIGVTMEIIKESRRKKADEMIIARSLSERKALMLEKGDAIILLAGGIGSLDEITEILELKKHDRHQKPIVVLNTDNFYEGLEIQMKRMEKDGFLTKKLEEFIRFADTPEEAIEYINKSLR